ncbi:hypothetical protein U1Q18_038976 [Sarracenia purpurea var. burkii]
MSSTLKIARPMTRTRRIPKSQRRFYRTRKISKTVVNGGSDAPPCSSSVSDKLEALRNLIPAQDGEVKSDQLFQKTADYIVLLQTQALILQRLLDFYGSNDENDNAL